MAPVGTLGAGATGGSTGMSSSMIGAVTVAVVLLVGGALFFITGGDGSDAVDSVAPASAPGGTSGTPTAPPSTEPVSTPGPSTSLAPTTAPPTTLAPTTAPLTTLPPTTLAPVPSPPPPTVPPQPTAPPTTAAPVPTVAPGVGTVTFDQAAAFYRGYIATAVSGDYVNAWNMLSARDQGDYERGFDQFVGFWQSVSFADVQQLERLGGSTGFQSMRAEMAYGQVDGDPTSFEVIEVDVNVRPDGSLQIFDYRFIGPQ